VAYGIYVATAGAVARQTQLDVVANNLANANTVGFRAQELTFQEVMYDEFESPDRHLVATQGLEVSHRAGPIQTTNDPADVALDGPGFFAVGSPAAPVLVRSLRLQVGAGGVVTDAHGRAVVGAQGVLRADPGRSITVTKAGEVIQDETSLGQLQVMSVANIRGLQPSGYGGYMPTSASGPAYAAEGSVIPGAVEGSNVDSLQSMVQLITLQRDYQSLTRAIHAYREADEGLIQTARGR
jgi:flagellar basal body rod protein FlgG